MKPAIPTLLSTALLTMFLAACGSAEVVPREVPAPPVTSVAQADQQLAAVARERAAIESRYAEREAACYKKFLVTNCLDEAKERRRSALTAQRAIEIQAAHFKRMALVEDRDRQLAEAEKRYQEQEARMAAEGPKAPRAVAPEPAPPRPSDVAKRAAQRDARVQADAGKQAKDAELRAQNVRAYEERKAESEERQRRVAERKAERAAKAAKEAEEAKSKAAQAPK